MANIIEQSKKILEHIIKLSANDTLTAQEWLDLVEAFTEVMHGGDTTLKGLYTQAEQALINANQMIKSKISNGEELLKVQKAEQILGDVRPIIKNPSVFLDNNNTVNNIIQVTPSIDSNIQPHPLYTYDEIFIRISMVDNRGKEVKAQYISGAKSIKGDIPSKSMDALNSDYGADTGWVVGKSYGSDANFEPDLSEYTEDELKNEIDITVNVWYETPSGVKSYVASNIITHGTWKKIYNWAGFYKVVSNSAGIVPGSILPGGGGKDNFGRIHVYNSISGDATQISNKTRHETCLMEQDPRLPFYWMRRWVVRNNRPGAHNGTPDITIDVAGNYKDNIKSPSNALTGWDANSVLDPKFTQLDPDKDQIFVSVPDHYVIDIGFNCDYANNTHELIFKAVCMKPFEVDLTIDNDPTMRLSNIRNVKGVYETLQGNIVTAKKVDGFMFSAFPVLTNKTGKYVGSYPMANVKIQGNQNQMKTTANTALVDVAKWMHHTTPDIDTHTNIKPECWWHRSALLRLISVDMGDNIGVKFGGSVGSSGNINLLTKKFPARYLGASLSPSKSEIQLPIASLYLGSITGVSSATGNALSNITTKPKDNDTLNQTISNNMNPGRSFISIITNFRGIGSLWYEYPSLLMGVYKGTNDITVITPQKDNIILPKNITELQNGQQDGTNITFDKTIIPRTQYDGNYWDNGYPKTFYYDCNNKEFGSMFPDITKKLDNNLQDSTYNAYGVGSSIELPGALIGDDNGLAYILHGGAKETNKGVTLFQNFDKGQADLYTFINCENPHGQYGVTKNEDIYQIRSAFPLTLLPKKDQEMIMGKHNEIINMI